MIQANELRIGNWIQLRNIRERGKQVFPFKVEVKDLVTLCKNIPYVKRCEPILLTPEILQKCGFHKHNNAWVLDSYNEKAYNHWDFSIYDVFDFADVHYNSAEFPVRLNSLHQLQNLYFALTGQELVIDY